MSIETVSKIVDCGRKIWNDVHIDTYYCKPELISWRQISTSVKHAFLSPTDQKYANSSTYWQFLYYRPPGKFWSFQQERSLKCDAKNSTYIYDIYHPLDDRFGFSLSIGNTKNHVTTLTCLEWLLKYVNISIILAPKLTSHSCALLIDNVGNYLCLNDGRFKFEVDPHQFNLRLHHFSQFQH